MSKIQNIDVAVLAYKEPKWYNHPVFPLIPIWRKKKADMFNTSSFSLSWLFFQFWTLDSFSFELAIVADAHWGFGVTAILPYLRIRVTIPIPFKWSRWINNKLSRKPSGYPYFTTTTTKKLE